MLKKVISDGVIILVRADRKADISRYEREHKELCLLTEDKMEGVSEYWAWFVQEQYYKEGYIRIPLNERIIILLDPGYARLRVMLPDEEGNAHTFSYPEWLIKAATIFERDNCSLMVIPQTDVGQIHIIKVE